MGSSKVQRFYFERLTDPPLCKCERFELENFILSKLCNHQQYNLSFSFELRLFKSKSEFQQLYE